MSRFNDNLSNIGIGSLAIFIIVSYLVLNILGKFTIINQKWIYVFILLFFAFVLRNCLDDLKNDFSNVFSKVEFKHLLLIVFLNIFFSYGMLYLSGWIADFFPAFNFMGDFHIPFMSLSAAGVFITTVIISPLSEELIFRGVLLNRLKLFTPTIFAVLISSLLFGSLHSFGSILSAFVFGICMAILYLKSENICVPILAHFLNNLFAEIIRFADYNQLLFTNEWVMGIVGILALISAFVLISSLVKELKTLNNK